MDYEKNYKEALKRAKDLHSRFDENFKKEIEGVFPELKEAVLNKKQEEQVSKEFINALGTMLNDGLPDRYFVPEERIKESAELLFSIARKQLKNEMQEWSEEDERNLQGIIDEIEANKNQAPDYDIATYDRFLSWLKSLRPQNRWKPSKEQMQALSDAGNSFRPFEEGHKVLWSLYNDLKKLREE